MKHVLFVCHGNICRSPMAEFYFRRLVEEAGLGDKIEVQSAAVSDEEEGNPVYPLAKRTLAQHGIGCKGKVSQVITPDMYDESDYVVCMDTSNVRIMESLLRLGKDHKAKRLLDHVQPENKAYHGRDVKDPWYTRNFDQAWDDITTGCEALLEIVRAETDEN